MSQPPAPPATLLRRAGSLHPLRLLGRMSVWTWRIALAIVLVAGFGAAAVVLSLRYYVLPNIDQHRDRIAGMASDAIGQQVTIGRIDADWKGLRPHLSMLQVIIHDAAGRPALELDRVEATMSWRAAAVGAGNSRALEIVGPNLTIRRDADGQLSVAGLPVTGGTGRGGFARWVLAQRDIVIRDASVVWIDEARGAPELWLRQVNLRLETRGRRHRLGVSAVPPDGLAAPLDIRAEWRGSDFTGLSAWDGRVFAQLRDTSLSGWEAWIDLPGGVERGSGSLRLWADLRDGRVTALITDVELTDVRARFARELAALELEAMSGRLSWRELDDGFELTAAGLSLAQAGRAPAPPTVARLRWHDSPAAGAPGRTPPLAVRSRGELTANSLDLEPWMALADQVPLDPAVRTLLGELAPRGRLADVAIAWAGAFPALDNWSVRARFSGLSVNPRGVWPGVTGLTGSIDGSDRGGSAVIEAPGLALTAPAVFTRALAFDTFTAQANWAGRGQKFALRVTNLAVANADLAGTLSGEYRPFESAAGFADLSASLSRVEGRAVAGYLPLRVDVYTREWLARALLAGRSRDVRLRLRGDLADFPFSLRGRDRGQFLLSVKFEDAELDFAPGWPRLTDLDGDLVFRGSGLEVTPRRATIAGVRLQRVRAAIPDLFHGETVLEVSGEAESATADFLRFIVQSPLDELLDGATRDMQAQGRGRLALKLMLPLQRVKDTTVAGSYQFLANRLTVAPDLPVLDAVYGRLEFSESGVRVNGATAQLLGGPATLNIASQRDGTLRVGLVGKASAAMLRRELPEALGQALRGETDWRATINYRRKLGDLVLESSLVGLAIDLPPPLDKTAGEAWPLRLEQVSGPQRDRLSLSLGNVVSAQVLRRIDAGTASVERATLALGGAPAPVPERRGLAVSGSLKTLNVDQWRLLLDRMPVPGGDAAGGRGRLDLGDIDLRVGQVELLGRRFNEVVVRTTAQPGGLRGSIASTELSGDLDWRSQGGGRLIARLRHLDLRPSEATSAALGQAKVDERALPALDVTVDDFRLGGKALGRLELQAVPAARDWRIERLRVVNPDATFNMDGMWQSWRANPRTQVNVRLDIADGGRLLKRLGYPEGVRGGAGRIEGPLSWAGSPQNLDVATLSGNLAMDIGKGQFLTLEPGVGRLLGVFNLQNLPRRIALDFRDVFSEGFSFDEIAGSMRVERGIGRLDNFRIEGPSARVLMSGEINLPKETQNLHVRVTPAIGDGLAIAGALLGGPIAGIASFVLQRVLKDPLAQFATFDYAVTGTWSEPAVNRVPRPAAAPEKEGP